MHSRQSFLRTLGTVLSFSRLCRGSKIWTNGPIEETDQPTAEKKALFPRELAPFQWQTFEARGFTEPVTGVIYRSQLVDPWGPLSDSIQIRPVSGVPLGGVDTGGINLEGSGSFGYSSIFNSYSPDGGPLNSPYLGMGLNRKTWVLTTGLTNNYCGEDRPAVGPSLAAPLRQGGVQLADSIDLLGHYPIVDFQYKTDAPIQVSMRAWSPFIPGDSKESNTPGAIFENRLENQARARQSGTFAFSFPGFPKHQTRDEIIDWPELSQKPILPLPRIQRQKVEDDTIRGVFVQNKTWTMSYFVGTLIDATIRIGGELGTDGSRWAQIESILPEAAEDSDDGGASLALDFTVETGQEKTIRIILAWFAPESEGNGCPGIGSIAISGEHFPVQTELKLTSGAHFTHMYATRFDSAVSVAKYLAKRHSSLLQRITAWQSAIYQEPELPGWLADTLINAFYYFAPCSIWAQAKPPIGSWCKPEDGIFGMWESPRSCPHMATFKNYAMAGPLLSMLFPDLALSSLRALRAAQHPNGDIPQVLCLWMDVATPQGYRYQEVMMGANYIVHYYWLWKSFGDDAILSEFYPSAKKILQHSFSSRPDLGLSQIIEMPNGDQLEWFEDRQMFGYETHAGGYRLAAAEMMSECAAKMGDDRYRQELDAMVSAGKEAMQKYLWKRNHYLVFNDTTKSNFFDAFITPQLNGQYYAHISGVPGVFPRENVEKVLTVMRERVCKISKWGLPPNYANPDGTMLTGETTKYLTGKYLYNNHQVIWAAVLAIFEGDRDCGLKMLR
jgi:uncharacterized protein (DUF608 family)